jgi:hypothetical protein
MDISDLSTRQIANALVIFAAALPFGGDAAKAALMTAAAESSFKRYANNGDSTRPEVWAAYGGRQNFRDVIRQSLTFPHDAEAGAAWTTADSLGLFQQRPMYDYGEIRDLMDPAESTRIFVRGSQGGSTRYFLESPKTMSLAQRCQWTQGSEFPTGENYVPMEVVADQLIAHFGGLPKVKDWFVANNWDEALAELKTVLDDRAPKVITFYDQMGGSHFVAYPNGTYVQVPNPMGDDGVLAAHLGHLAKMGVTVVDIGASDPFMFGHRVEWSGRPDSTTAY